MKTKINFDYVLVSPHKRGILEYYYIYILIKYYILYLFIFLLLNLKYN